MDDRVTDLLRRTLAAKAAEIDSDDEQPFTARATSVAVGAPLGRAARWPWWAAAAAIAALLVGAAVVVGRGGSDGGGTLRPGPADPPSVPILPVDPTAPDTTAVPTPDEDGLADSAAVASNATGWFLPTYIPDGLVPMSTSAMRPDFPPGTGLVTNSAWIRRSDDGSIDGRFWITAFPSTSGPNVADSWATVHGGPAHVQDDEGGRYVAWFEAGLMINVRSELSLEETVAIAEQTIVDVSGVSFASPPAGFEQPQAAPSELPPAGALETSVRWNAQDEALWVGFGAMPNTAGRSLDTVVTVGVPTRIQLGEVQAIIDRRIYDADSTTATTEPVHESVIRWFADGFVLNVSGPTSIENELVAMARSVQPASEAAFHAIDADATERMLEVPAADEAVFADGLRVSFRTGDGSVTTRSSPTALCAGTVRRHCAQGAGGASGSISAGDAGDIDTTTFEHDHYHALFSVNGRRELIMWVRGVDLQPQVSSITSTSMDPLPFEAVHTAIGMFIRIPAESSVAEVRVNTATGGAGTAIAYQVFDPDVG